LREILVNVRQKASRQKIVFPDWIGDRIDRKKKDKTKSHGSFCTKTHHKCEERTGRSKIQGVHNGVQPAVSWYQETGTHARTSSECMRRKRDQDFYAERGAHEDASRGEIAYTTDNKRELA
jgi:hypothetical protein